MSQLSLQDISITGFLLERSLLTRESFPQNKHQKNQLSHNFDYTHSSIM